jgi:hypothetical protein
MLLYQWYKDGAAISGGTNSSYTIPSVTAADAGTYSAIVLNKMGRQIRSGATLTVTAAAPSLSGAAHANGVFQMLVSGSAGNYTIQATTNLSTNSAVIVWENVYSTNGTTPPFIWADSTVSNYPMRFYRVLFGP